MVASRSWLLLAALGLLNSGCFIFGAAPPGRLDIGPALLVSNNKPTPSARFTVGAHLASALEDPLPFDVGLGYTLKTGEGEPPPPESGTNKPELIYYHGVYLETLYGFQIGEEDWSRGWVGVRGELIDGVRGGGIVARGSWEVWTYVEAASAGSNRTAAGALAADGRLGIGVFLESGYQLLPVGGTTVDAFMITTGVSFRFPAFAAAGIALIPWKI